MATKGSSDDIIEVLQEKPCEKSLDVTKRTNFLQPLENDGNPNGFIINDRAIPEEIFKNILGNVPPDQLIHLALVSKSWCRMIRTGNLWSKMYRRKYKKKTKNYPWYVFYAVFTGRLDNNLMRSNDGLKSYDSNTNNGITKWSSNEIIWSTPDIHLKISADKLLSYIIKVHKPFVYIQMYIPAYDVTRFKSMFMDDIRVDDYVTFDWGQWIQINLCTPKYSLDFVRDVIFYNNAQLDDSGVLMFALESIRID